LSPSERREEAYISECCRQEASCVRKGQKSHYLVRIRHVIKGSAEPHHPRPELHLQLQSYTVISNISLNNQAIHPSQVTSHCPALTGTSPKLLRDLLPLYITGRPEDTAPEPLKAAQQRPNQNAGDTDSPASFYLATEATEHPLVPARDVIENQPGP
jgi:hypothetical protein